MYNASFQRLAGIADSLPALPRAPHTPECFPSCQCACQPLHLFLEARLLTRPPFPSLFVAKTQPLGCCFVASPNARTIPTLSKAFRRTILRPLFLPQPLLVPHLSFPQPADPVWPDFPALAFAPLQLRALNMYHVPFGRAPSCQRSQWVNE